MVFGEFKERNREFNGEGEEQLFATSCSLVRIECNAEDLNSAKYKENGGGGFVEEKLWRKK